MGGVTALEFEVVAGADVDAAGRGEESADA